MVSFYVCETQELCVRHQQFLHFISAGKATNSQLFRARSLVVNDLRLETKGFRFESDCWLCVKVSSLQ